MFKNRPTSHYVVAAVALVLFAFLASTCEGGSQVAACDAPVPGSDGDLALQDARARAGFPVRYPCYLPNSQVLESTAVTGTPGRQLVSLVWRGPFDFTIRQAQYPPAVSPDPSGASRTTVDLFPSTRATLIERNDGSGQSMYHLFWQEKDVYYELQAFGPPQQRRVILEIARSLE